MTLWINRIRSAIYKQLASPSLNRDFQRLLHFSADNHLVAVKEQI
jgi:hypothetical protein